MPIPADDAAHPKVQVPVTLEDQEKVPADPVADPRVVLGVVPEAVDSMVAAMEVSEVAKLQPAHSAEKLPEKLDQWSKAQAISISAQTAQISARTYSARNKDA